MVDGPPHLVEKEIVDARNWTVNGQPAARAHRFDIERY
jgi:hypothetical protein